MNILVTGGSGFIGSHVVDKLLLEGHMVRILDIKSPHREDVEFIQGSIVSKEDIVKAVRNIEVVYHFGGFSNIDLVKNNPVETINLNIMGTTFLLEACRDSGIKRFLFASSVYVHEEKGHLYTTSKLASELICKDYQKLYDVSYTILRLGTVYGPRSRNADVISIFVQRALRGENLVIHGTGEQKRNFIYVGDLAEGSVLALRPGGINETFVFAGKETVTINELAQKVKAIVYQDVKLIFNPSAEREDDYFGQIEGISRTEELLGWVPKTSLNGGIKKYLVWLESQRNHFE